MRGGEAFHVVDLAVRGRAPVIGMSVPTCDSGFAVVNFSGDVRGRRSLGAAVLLVRAAGESEPGPRQRGDRNRAAKGHLVRSYRLRAARARTKSHVCGAASPRTIHDVNGFE